MNWKKPGDITLQVTVNQLTLSSLLSREDIRVTVSVNDESKTTCSGKLSEDSFNPSRQYFIDKL